MKKLLFIIAVLFSLGIKAQTFTPIHNYQAPDGLDVAKFFGIPHGANPTLNGVNRPGGHPLFYNTTDSSLYLYSGNQWIRVGGGNGNEDTVKVGYGLNVIWDSTGQQLLYADHEDGLVNGGIVTKGVADWDLDVTDASFYKNHQPYSTNSSTVTIDTADATYDRIDAIGVDTTGNVVVITGTPSATPIAPQVNPSSQLLLTTITVKAGSTFAPVITKIIYDEGTEWDTATSGTISAFFNNEDNPYHDTKDIFVQTYENGGALEFTDSEPDTATSNMVLKYFLYLNDEFTNSFQVQFFNDSDPVSNSLSFNSGYGLNPNNVNVYQNISIPLTSFVFSSNIFNKLKITMAGEDVSGAAGYYLDYIQLQKGLSQTGSGSCPLCIVDIHVTADSMYQVSIRQNGDTASVINWTGGGSGGITQSQLDDSTAAIRADFPAAGIQSVVAGTNVTVDNTDPLNPVLSASGTGGTGGISQLGSPTFGLTRVNDSTYTADTINDLTSKLRSDSLSNAIALKLDSVTLSTDTLYGWKNGIRYFQFKSSAFNQWNTNGSNIYYNTGNVGIGVDTPSAKLSVITNNVGTTTSSANGILLANNTPATSNSDVQNSSSLVFKGGGYNITTSTPRTALFRAVLRGAAFTSGNNSSGRLVFETSADSGSTWNDVISFERAFNSSNITIGGIIITGNSISGSAVSSLGSITGTSLTLTQFATNSNKTNFTNTGTFTANNTGTYTVNDFLSGGSINTTAGTTNFTGFKFAPTIVNSTGLTLTAFTNTIANNYFNTTSGSTGIGTSSIPSNTIFKVSSTTQTSHPFPNMTASQMAAITSPNVGDHVYQTDGTEGVYVYKSDSTWHFAY